MILKLSESNIKDLIEDVEYLEDSLTFASRNIVKRLVDAGYDKADYFNNNAAQSSNTKSIVIKDTGRTTRNGVSGAISLVGESAIYDEFGTGEEGASDPHPMKNDFTGLNPYNHGPFVSTHINKKTGKHYWFYTFDGDSDYYLPSGYTEGIPSGKQMYNTLGYIRSIKQNIINEELNGATKTLR